MTLTDWPDPYQTGALPGTAATYHAVRVYLPPLEVLTRRWSEVEPLLERATSRTGCYEPVDLLAMAFAGKVGIWLCLWCDQIDAVIVAQPVDYPRRRILEMMFAGGNNMRRWLKPLRAAIDQHARDLGCSHVATTGRRGWGRVWPGDETGDVVLTRKV